MPASLQDRFDMLMEHLPTLRLGRITGGGCTLTERSRHGDMLTVAVAGRTVTGTAKLRGHGEVATAQVARDDAAAVALWRDLRLGFIGWMERQTTTAQAQA